MIDTFYKSLNPNVYHLIEMFSQEYGTNFLKRRKRWDCDGCFESENNSITIHKDSIHKYFALFHELGHAFRWFEFGDINQRKYDKLLCSYYFEERFADEFAKHLCDSFSASDSGYHDRVLMFSKSHPKFMSFEFRHANKFCDIVESAVNLFESKFIGVKYVNRNHLQQIQSSDRQKEH